jgi:hypothetical protein
MDRDLYVHRFLLQEHLQHEALSNAAAASLHASRLYFNAGGMAAQFQENEFIRQHQEHLRRQHQQQQQQNHHHHHHHHQQQQQQEQHHIQQQQQQQYLVHHVQQQASNIANTTAASTSKLSTQSSLDPHSALNKVTFSANTTDNRMYNQSTPTRKRGTNIEDTKSEISSPKQPIIDSRPENSSASLTSINDTNVINKASTSSKKQANMRKPRKTSKILPNDEIATMKKTVLTVGVSDDIEDKIKATDTIINNLNEDEASIENHPQEYTETSRGTFDSLISAAKDEEKTANAAATIASFKETVHSKDLLDDDVSIPIISSVAEKDVSQQVSNDDEIISLPNFRSSLPRLPCEPEYDFNMKSHSPISVDSAQLIDKISPRSPSPDTSGKLIPDSSTKAIPMITEYPYPVDTWWPSITAIRKERRVHGEKSDEEDFEEESIGQKLFVV